MRQRCVRIHPPGRIARSHRLCSLRHRDLDSHIGHAAARPGIHLPVCRKVKLLHVVGARPNFPKLAPVHRAGVEAGLSQVVVHTGQHYDDALSDGFFRDLGIAPPDVNLAVGSDTHSVQTARIMERIEPTSPRAHSGARADYWTASRRAQDLRTASRPGTSRLRPKQ